MEIGLVYHSIFMIAGHVRQGLTIADALKSLGHKVRIYSREPATKKYIVRLKGIGGITEITVISGTIVHFEKDELKKYYPLKYVTPDDIVIKNMPPIHPYVVGFKSLEEIYNENDVVIGMEELYAYLPCFFDSNKIISYIHFPTVEKPSEYPREFWTNSVFTKNTIVSKWHVPPSIVDVVYPAIYFELYKYRDVSEREYDIVVFSRLSKDKLIWLDKLLNDLKKYKIAIAGSNFGAVPKAKVDTFVNISFDEVVDLLSRSKIYVHMRGFQSEPEHFGIAPLEAMACGAVPVVHMSGGTWIDILEEGKYGVGYSNPDEAVLKIKELLSDEEKLSKYSRIARERAKYFSFERLRSKLDEKIKKLFY